MAALIEALIQPAADVVIGVAGYIFEEYWNKLDEVGVYETVVLSVCVSLAVALFLYLQQILDVAIKYKHYVPFLVFIVCLGIFFVRLSWNQYTHSKNITNNSQNVYGTPTQTSKPAIVFKPSPSPSVPSEESNLHKEEEIIVQTIDSELNQDKQKQSPSDVSKDDCEKYSKFLFSQAKITVSKKYKLEGYLEVFGRSVNFIGKPTIPVISEDFVPPAFKGEMMDVMNRRHNTEATSTLNVQDAVEKALIKLCDKLKQLGYA